MRFVFYFFTAYVRAPAIVHRLPQFMSYITRSRLFLSAMLLSGGFSPVQAAPFPAQAWVYATVGLTTAQAPSPTIRRVPAAAELTDVTPASSDPLTTVLPELASEAAQSSAQMSTPLGLLSEHMQKWMAQALTPGQVARTLSSFGSTGAGGVAGNMAQSLIDQGWDGLEEKLRGNFFRTINLNWRPGYGGREDLLQIDTVMSLWDQGNNSIFGQAGLQSRDGEGGLHVGLGYRARPVEEVLLGLNVFYDYLSDPEVSRYSVGAEAQSAYAGVSGNWYQGLSDERLADGRTAYSPDGFDIEFSGRMPGLPYLELTGRYYRWSGQGETRDLKGTEYGLKLTPVPLFTVKGVYEDLSGGGDDVGVEASMEYRFGVPWQEQLRSSALASRNDPWNRRFERVRRQYEQRVQYRGTVTTGGSGALSSELIIISPLDRDPQGELKGVRLTFPALLATVSEIDISWALTATPGTELGTATVQRSELRASPTVDGQYSFNLTRAATGFTFVGATSYRFTAMLKSASGAVVATRTGDGPGPDGSGLIVSTSAGSDTLFLSWQRQAGAQSARLSWRQASTLGVSDAAGAVPLVENEEITLDLTDPAICLSGTTCTYTIRGLQAGTQYVVTLQIYSGANAGGTHLNNSSVTLMTSNSRDTSIVSVAASPSTITEGGSAGTITLTASPAPDVRGGLSVPFTITGTDVTADDYTLTDADGNAVVSPVVIPAGEDSVALTLTAVDDADTGVETLIYTLMTGTGYTVGGTGTAMVRITDASMPVVSFTADAVTVAETAGSVTLTLQLSGAAPSALSVPVTVTAGTATAGADYTALAADAMVAFATGTATQTVSVTILNDALPEGAETFTVALTLPPSSVVMAGETTSVTVTITDDDAPLVSFTTGTVSTGEGEGDGTVEVSVRLSASPSANLAIPVTTNDGTALAGSDYSTVSSVVSFAAEASGADLTQTVSVPITDDSTGELPETFTVVFGTLPAGVSSGTPASVTVTITDNDTPMLSFSAATATMNEAAGRVDLTLQLSGSPVATVAIPVMTANGTAMAGQDYTALSGETVMFTSGATGAALSQMVSVPILNDSRQEDDETFTVSLGTLPPGMSSGALASVTVTITDDDAPTVSFSSSTARVGEASGPLVVTVQLNVSPLSEIVVPVITGDVRARAGSDYTALSGEMVTFVAGATGAALSQTVSVEITDDTAPEGNEIFTLSFGSPLMGVMVGTPARVTVTVVDDDVPTVSFIGAATRSVTEAAGTVELTVALSAALTSPVTIPVLTISETGTGTATAGSDYTALSMDLTFAANATGADLMQTVSVAIVNDTADENDETFTVALGTLPPTVSGSGTVTVTITDDDTPTASFTGAATRSVTEAAGTVELTVALDTTPGADIRIPVMTGNGGTATVGQDYSNVSRDVVFDAGAVGAALRQTVSVAILNDSADENDETFTIALGTVPPGVLSGTVLSVTVTITDDDVPTLSVAASPATITEGAASTITITSTIAPVTDLTVPFTITGTGITTADYTLASGGSALTGTEVMLAAGATSMALTLTAVNDADAAEMLTLALAPPVFDAGYVIGGTNTAEITIEPRLDLMVQFAESEYAIDETSAVIEVVVVATGTTANPVTIPIMTADDTARAGDDYVALMTTLTFPAGAGGSDLRQTLTVNLINDALTEGPEQFLLSFGTLPVGVAVSGNSTSTIRLLDDDSGNVGFVSNTATISEDGGTLDLVVQVDALISEDLTVTYMVMDGGSATSGDDYTLAAGTLPLFAAGVIGADLMQTVSVPIVNDDVDEGSETFTVALTSARIGDVADLELGGAGLAESIVVTIIDDDGSKPMLSVATDRVSAIVGETIEIKITASMALAPAGELMIPFSVSGTGITPADYTLTDTIGTLLTTDVTLPMGHTSVVLLLSVDTAVETLTFTLDAVADDAAYTVSPTAVTVAINPQGGVNLPVVYVTPPPPPPSQDPTSIEEGARTRITLHAVPAPSTDLTIPFIIGGAGITPADYALTTQAGAPVTTGQVTLPAGANSVALILTAADDADTDETLSFLLTVPVAGAGYMLNALNLAQVRITPSLSSSPLTVKFSKASVSIKETFAANPQTNTVAFDVVLSDLPRRSIEIPVMTRDGTATAGADYTAISETLTFTGSTLSRRVMIELADDDVYEGEADETFMVVFGALPSGVTAGTPASVTVMIDDDEAPELLSISAAHSTIGSGRTTTTIHITASFVPSSDLQIPLSITTGGGMLGRDFTLTEASRAGGGRPVTTSESTVTLPAGEISRAFRMEIIPTRPDTQGSPVATFRLRDGTGYTVSPTNSVTNVTIRNLRYVEFTNDAIPPVNEDAGTVTVGITSGGPRQIDPSIVFRVPIVITGGTATVGEDYRPSSRMIVSLPSGTTDGTITIPIIDDAIYENDETLILSFGDLSEMGLKAGSVPGTTVTITDDDALSISFANAALTLPEDAGTVNVEMRLNRATAVPVTLQIAAAPATPAATLNTDYSIPNASVTFTPPATTAMLTLSITDDILAEGNELFQLSLEENPPARVTLAAPAVITIADNDIRTLSVAATPAVINEGGTSTITITASPDLPVDDLTIAYTINGSGIMPADYMLTAGSTALTELTGVVTLPMNETSVTLTLTAVDDADTIAETLTLTLNAGTGYTVSSTAGSAKVTINPFAQTVQFAASNVEVAENVGMVPVTVELSVPAAGEISIPIMTMDGTAMAGTDYTTVMTDVVIADGTTTGSVMIPILDDSTLEANEEVFTVSFGTLPAGVMEVARNRQLTVSILDDDVLTIRGFSAATMEVNENVGTLTLEVDVSQTAGAGLPVDLELNYTWSAGTAAAFDDFDPIPLGLRREVALVAGNTSFIVRATIVDDDLVEGSETMSVRLFSASRLMITIPAVTITIIDNDPPAP